MSTRAKKTLRSRGGAASAAGSPALDMDPGAYSRVFSGLVVMLGLTYRCQCSCSSCGMGLYRKTGKKEFTTREWMKIIGDLPEKTESVSFFGGEPTLRSDLPDLLRRAKQKGLRTSMDTNGELLTPGYVKKLKDSGLDLVYISLDSSDPEVHDKLRGRPGLFNRAVSALVSCRREGLPCAVSTYATKKSIRNGELKKVIRLAEKLNATFMRILPPLLTGKWLRAENLRLDAEELKLLNGLLRKGFSYLEDDYCMSINKKIVYVSPYGDVQPCCYVPFSFGNVKDTPLKTILDKLWKHPMYGAKTKTCVMNNKEFREKYLRKIELPAELPVPFDQAAARRS